MTRALVAWGAVGGAVSVVLLAGACFDRTVPEDSSIVIRCEADEECPPDWFCQVAPGRCAPGLRTDDEAPRFLVGPELTPAAGTRETVFEVRFEVSEPLTVSAPFVRVGLSDAVEVPFALDPQSDQQQFVFTLAATELPDGSWPVLIDLTDDVGNELPDQLAGTLRLDSLGPRAIDLEGPTPRFLKEGTQATWTLTVDEALQPEATLTLIGIGDTALLLEEQQTGAYTLSTLPADPDLGERTAAAALLVSDQAGNPSTFDLGELVFDFSPPNLEQVQVEGAVGEDGEPPRWRASLGALVRVALSHDEQLAAPLPQVTLVDDDGSVVATFERLGDDLPSSAQSHQLLVTGLADGSYGLRLDGHTDRALNEREATQLGTLVIDGTAPAISDLVVDPIAVSAVPGFDTFTASAAITGDLSEVEGTLAGQPITCTSEPSETEPALHRLTCTASLSGLEAVAEPSAALVVLARDAAGNLGTAATAVLVDHTPPSLLEDPSLVLLPPPGSAIASPDVLQLQGRAEVRFSLDDVVTNAPTVQATGAQTLSFEALSTPGAENHLYELRLMTSAPAGAYALETTLVDDLGNQATVPLMVPAPGLVVGEITEAPCLATDPTDAPVCTDFDGDGFFGAGPHCPAGDDCHDVNATVFPLAPEIPGDGLDNGCEGDADAPIDETTGVFVAEGGSPGAAGTRADPFDTVTEAMAAAQADGRLVFVQEGTYAEPTPVDEQPRWSSSIVGGLDAQWQLMADGRSTISFLSIEALFFQPSLPGLVYGVDVTATGSANQFFAVLTMAGPSGALLANSRVAPLTPMNSYGASLDVATGALTVVGCELVAGVDLGTPVEGQVAFQATQAVSALRLVQTKLVIEDGAGGVGNTAAPTMLARVVVEDRSNNLFGGIQTVEELIVVNSRLAGNAAVYGFDTPFTIAHSVIGDDHVDVGAALILEAPAAAVVSVNNVFAPPAVNNNAVFLSYFETGLDTRWAGSLFSSDASWAFSNEGGGLESYAAFAACAWANCTSFDASNVEGDPGLDADGLHLTASSEAIGIGVDPFVWGAPSTAVADYDGTCRTRLGSDAGLHQRGP